MEKLRNTIRNLRYFIKQPLRTLDSMQWMYKARKRNSFREDTIYDVGMHNGQDTAFYLKKGFRVIAIEANPELAARAIRHFKSFIDKGQLRIINVGIADSNSPNGLSFFVNEHQSEWSSFREETAARNNSPVHRVTVPTRTLASVIQEYGDPYFVKIDIEDLDRVALESLLTLKCKAKFVSVENGNQGMLHMLIEAGYDSFKYIQQNNIPNMQLERLAREGDYAGHLFPFGASGPFGEETPGTWKRADEIEKEISKVWDVNGFEKRAGHDDRIHGWFDLHARHSDAI